MLHKIILDRSILVNQIFTVVVIHLHYYIVPGTSLPCKWTHLHGHMGRQEQSCILPIIVILHTP